MVEDDGPRPARRRKTPIRARAAAPSSRLHQAASSGDPETASEAATEIAKRRIERLLKLARKGARETAEATGVRMFSMPAMAEALAVELEPELIGWCYETTLLLASATTVTRESVEAMRNEAAAQKIGEALRALADALFPFATVAEMVDLDYERARREGRTATREDDDLAMFTVTTTKGREIGSITLRDMRRARAARTLLLTPENADAETRKRALRRRP